MRGTINLSAVQAAVFNAVKGVTVRYAFYPALDPAAVATTSGGKIIASGNADWGAADVDIIAATKIATDYWICGINVHAAHAAAIFDIRLVTVADVVLAEFQIDLTAVQPNLGTQLLPFPIFMLANASVECRAGDDGGGGNIYIGILYALTL